MLYWLVDHFLLNLCLLIVVGTVCAGLWWSIRQRGFLIGAGAVAGLLVLLLVLRLLVVTDRERVVRSVESMADGVNAREPDEVLAEISDDFQLGGHDKATFARLARNRIRNGQITSLHVWDFEVSVDRSARTATVTFLVKGGGVFGEAFYRCRAAYVLDPDQRWRMKTFELFNPMSDPRTDDPINIRI